MFRTRASGLGGYGTDAIRAQTNERDPSRRDDHRGGVGRRGRVGVDFRQEPIPPLVLMPRDCSQAT
jgi:hypothetical protein